MCRLSLYWVALVVVDLTRHLITPEGRLSILQADSLLGRLGISPWYLAVVSRRGLSPGSLAAVSRRGLLPRSLAAVSRTSRQFSKAIIFHAPTSR